METIMSMRLLLLLTSLSAHVGAYAYTGVTQEAASYEYVLCNHCPAPTPKTIDLGDVSVSVARVPPVQVVNAPISEPLLIRFALNSVRISTADQLRLKQFATAISSNSTTSGIRITGHTDKLGSQRHNVKLAIARAEAVKVALMQDGLQPSRLETDSACCIGNPPLVNPAMRQVNVIEVQPADVSATQKGGSHTAQ